MTKYIMRLDDASEFMDIANWERMERLLDTYGILPIVGIIPDNRDKTMVGVYAKDEKFWIKANEWVEKGWCPALHGCEHRYISNDGGINPINHRSEFAGISFEEQAEKIIRGMNILQQHNIHPVMFFAPSHTFDQNTLTALKCSSDIKVISDTISSDVYVKDGLTFIPQQSGRARKLGFPFRVVTFCYHPNMMKDNDFVELESFLKRYSGHFVDPMKIVKKKREYTMIDCVLSKMYFFKRKIWR